MSNKLSKQLHCPGGFVFLDSQCQRDMPKLLF
jgi:hypothetical protein